MIDISNESMMIKEYETMFVNDKIKKKDRRMFFDNIAYVSSIDVILVFVIRLKQQKYVWDTYKKTLMNKRFETVIYDIKKRHELSFLKYRFVEKFVNAMQSHKKTTAKTTSWNWHFRLDHCRSEIINHFKKVDKMKVIQRKTSKIVQCDTCAVFKIHCLIQKKSSARATKFFQILHFDLIINNKTFDETTCIAHFIDELIFYTWVYSLINHKKKTLLSIFKDLINLYDRMRFDKRAIIRIIRTSQEIFIETKLKNWISEQDIK
jgi:hypothetical protein